MGGDIHHHHALTGKGRSATRSRADSNGQPLQRCVVRIGKAWCISLVDVFSLFIQHQDAAQGRGENLFHALHHGHQNAVQRLTDREHFQNAATKQLVALDLFALGDVCNHAHQTTILSAGIDKAPSGQTSPEFRPVFPPVQPVHIHHCDFAAQQRKHFFPALFALSGVYQRHILGALQRLQSPAKHPGHGLVGLGNTAMHVHQEDGHTRCIQNLPVQGIALRHGVEQVVEAGNQTSDFILAGHWQLFRRLPSIGQGRQRTDCRQHGRELPSQHPPRQHTSQQRQECRSEEHALLHGTYRRKGPISRQGNRHHPTHTGNALGRGKHFTPTGVDCNTRPLVTIDEPVCQCTGTRLHHLHDPRLVRRSQNRPALRVHHQQVGAVTGAVTLGNRIQEVGRAQIRQTHQRSHDPATVVLHGKHRGDEGDALEVHPRIGSASPPCQRQCTLKKRPVKVRSRLQWTVGRDQRCSQRAVGQYNNYPAIEEPLKYRATLQGTRESGRPGQQTAPNLSRHGFQSRQPLSELLLHTGSQEGRGFILLRSQ